MQKPFLRAVLCVGLFFILPIGAFGQGLASASYVAENHFGRITYLFARQEAEARVFYQGLGRLLLENGMEIYSQNDRDVQRRDVIDIFSTMFEQFFFDWEHHPETFVILEEVHNTDITGHYVSILSMDVYNIITRFGMIPHANFVYLSTSFGEEVLLSNIRR
ncbi:MAG: hypothetical protein FWH12_09730 [Treponema sp.]|nr:hypothetical protein [Treponema sp.]